MSVEQPRVNSHDDEAQTQNVNYNLDHRQQFCVEILTLLAKNHWKASMFNRVHVQGA